MAAPMDLVTLVTDRAINSAVELQQPTFPKETTMQRSRRCLLGAIAISALASGTPGFAQESNKPNNGVAAEEVGSAPPSPGACPATAATGFADPMSIPHWNGWGVDSSQRRFQPAEMAQLAAEDVPRLKLKWAFGFPGANFCVRTTDRDGRPGIRR
jgi:polyvinyl alcohol dehydrogenase (cytochrome)